MLVTREMACIGLIIADVEREPIVRFARHPTAAARLEAAKSIGSKSDFRRENDGIRHPE